MKITKKVVDYINKQGAWDTDRISRFLPPFALFEILGYHVPNLLRGFDRPIWGLTPDGCLLVKSAYDALNYLVQINNHSHNFVWDWKGPHRV